jgi:hypothetical protein
VLSGRLVGSPEAAAAAVRDLGKAEVLKCQVPAGGRGKAGGIAFVAGEAQATAGARRLLGTTLRGYRVAELLVEQRKEAEQEYYLGVTYDPVDRRPVLLASAGSNPRGRSARVAPGVRPLLNDVTCPPAPAAPARWTRYDGPTPRPGAESASSPAI